MTEYIDKKYLDRKFQIDMMCTRGGTLFDTEKIINSLPTANVIPIPAGATNGDMIKAMFPNIEVKEHMAYGFRNGIQVRVYINEFSVFDLWFPTRWWNTQYKKEVEE